MEDVLESLVKNEGKSKSNDAIKLLKTYVNNVVKNPSDAKFRRIRISNPKFHSIIWNIEDARSFLLLAGFEENGDFLVLPERVCLDEARMILDNFSMDDAPSTSKQTLSQPISTPSSPSKSLKLRKATDSSMFDEAVKADMTLLSYMKEMGFDVVVAEKALIITKNQGVQPALDWINNNPAKVNEIKLAAFMKSSADNETAIEKPDEHHKQSGQIATETAPVSRYQATIDERHRFQERLRLEAIAAARVEKAEQRRQKEYLLKNLEDEKKERKEKGLRTKVMRMGDEAATSGAKESSDGQVLTEKEEDIIFLKLRLPDGKVSNLKVPSKSPLGDIYKHVSEISNLQEEDFTVMLISPQRKLIDKEKSLEELGLKSHETLIVQRSDQTGSLTQGRGVFCQVLEVETVEQWESMLWKNNDKLIIVEFYALGSAECEHSAQMLEDLCAEYGVTKQAVFMRINIDLLPALKDDYDIVVCPTFKLVWNRETVCDVQGLDTEKLEKVVNENIHGPVTEKVADNTSEDYFDPR